MDLTDKNSVEISATITVRVATLKDAHTLAVIGAQTFYETFAAYNTADNMNLYLKKSFTDEQLEREIRDASATFLLAFDGDVVAGYAKLRMGNNPVEVVETNAIEIERIYSVKEYLGKKVGKTLMQACIEMASQQGFDVIWLGVWEQNPRAIDFYKKWGFEIFGSHPFMLGTDLQTDLLMKKKIK